MDMKCEINTKFDIRNEWMRDCPLEGNVKVPAHFLCPGLLPLPRLTCHCHLSQFTSFTPRLHLFTALVIDRVEEGVDTVAGAGNGESRWALSGEGDDVASG